MSIDKLIETMESKDIPMKEQHIIIKDYIKHRDHRQEIMDYNKNEYTLKARNQLEIADSYALGQIVNTYRLL